MEWLMIRLTSSGICLSGLPVSGDHLLLSALALSFGFCVITLCGFTIQLKSCSKDLKNLMQSARQSGNTKMTFAEIASPSLTELSKLLDEEMESR